MSAAATNQAIEAVWRIESARLIAGLARMVRDVGLAEDLAQDALVAALERWPESGVPDNPGAWLMATAKNRAIDLARRNTTLERKQEELARDVGMRMALERSEFEAAVDDEVGDDLLGLIFTCCHPVLPREARVALTLRLLGGLTTAEIARAFLVKESAIAQRLVRAKRTLRDANVPFEVPRGEELDARLPSVLEVIYLVFNEGYAASAGEDWIRPALCEEALRLGRILAALAPGEPEAHGLIALLEIQASRSRARLGPGGEPVLLLEQDRGRWDLLLIGRGLQSPGAGGSRARPARPLRPAGGDRRLPRPRPRGRGDRLGADRRPLRRPRPDRPLADRRAQPRRRPRHGLRTRGRPRTAGDDRRRALPAPVPPPAQRPRRPARETRAAAPRPRLSSSAPRR